LGEFEILRGPQGRAASRTPRRFPRPWGVGVGRVALGTQPVYFGNEVPAFLGQDIQVPLCHYLTPQGTGLLLQLKERSPAVLGGGGLVAVGGWHHLALSIRKDAPRGQYLPETRPLEGWERGAHLCPPPWPRTPHPRP
jgi:hypothetical protein